MLMELMLALLVIALVAAVALPLARPGGRPAALRATAQQAAALLRSDRTAAQRLGRTVATVFDPAARTLRSGVSGDVVALPEAFAARVDGARSGFSFHPDGRSSGGALRLASPAARLDVRVDGFTSTIEIRAPEAQAR